MEMSKKGSEGQLKLTNVEKRIIKHPGMSWMAGESKKRDSANTGMRHNS
jgi:hypothetical protein